jgi:hypothetical protein
MITFPKLFEAARHALRERVDIGGEILKFSASAVTQIFRKQKDHEDLIPSWSQATLPTGTVLGLASRSKKGMCVC